MPKQITPYIEQFYEDEQIWAIINKNANILAQLNDPAVKNSKVCVVIPIVRREKGFKPNQFDLDILIKHALVTDLGELELYRMKDFIRQKVDVAPVMETLRQVTGVEVKAVLESIKAQIKFLQKVENRDLPFAPAQMLNSK